MLHHYNYSTSLSHFLSYHQLDEQNNDNESGVHATSNVGLCDELSQEEEDSRCRSNSSVASHNKSFTIAAILGLKNDEKDIQSENEMSVMNLSVHPERQMMSNCSRLQLPNVHRPVTGHFPAGHPCASAMQTVRGLKHMSSTAMHQHQHQQQQQHHQKKNCKSKRVRTIFTPEQLERLEAEFERQQYMVGPERLYLAHTLQLTEAQVKVWFQNRRIKWRKHHLELTHQRLAVLKQQQLLLEDSQPDVQDTNSSGTDT